MKCLITGAGGFIGGHLVEHFLGQGAEVYAMDVVESPVLRALGDSVRTCEANIVDRDQTAAVMREVRPDVVCHLAAQSLPSVSWDDPAGTFEVNVLGCVNVLEAARGAGGEPVVLVVCSSGEYALSRDGRPIPESGELGPSTPYGISKMVEDHIARLYGVKYGMRIIRLRPFFLVGPRKVGDVCSDFASGIVAIERGERDHLAVGNLDVVRDMLDVRDGVAAFAMLAERGEAGEVYNICSGQGYRIGDVLERLKRLSTVPITVAQDPARLRPVEEMVKIGDPGKLNALGWKPSYNLDDTLKDILEYWRSR